MRYITAEAFEKAFRSLPEEIKKKVRKAFILFKENPRHPSLQVKKIKGTQGVFEGRIDRRYRFTFHYEGDAVVFRNVGPHDIVKDEHD